MNLRQAADRVVARMRVYGFDLSAAVLAGALLVALAPVVNYRYPGLELDARALFFVGFFLVTTVLTWHRGRWSQLDKELAALEKRRKDKTLKPAECDALRQRAIARFGQGRYGSPQPPEAPAEPPKPTS